MLKCHSLDQKISPKDLTTTEETLKQALIQSETFYRKKFDICVFLTCTNLFRQASWIKKAVNILKKDKDIDSAFSVHKFYKHIWHEKKKIKKSFALDE